MRSASFCPVVTGAVLIFPFPSRQRASRSPLRVMISAPGGSGRVTVFLKRLPIVLPLANREPEVSGEPVGHIQSDRLTAINKSLDAGSGNPSLPRQGLVADATVDNCSSQNVGHAVGGLASAHG